MPGALELILLVCASSKSIFKGVLTVLSLLPVFLILFASSLSTLDLFLIACACSLSIFNSFLTSLDDFLIAYASSKVF